MAIIPEEQDTSPDRLSLPKRTVSDEVRELRRKVGLMEKTKETEDTSKQFKFPFRWQFKFRSAKKKNAETQLVMFFNKKNEIEGPKFMPIYSGNMIVYKNKPYEFDPRAIWRIKTKGYPMVYCIKETDRRPIANRSGQVYYTDAAITNQDMEEIRKRGDSTESDEFLIKAALKAQTAQTIKSNWIIAAIVIGVIIIGVIWFISRGPSITRAPTTGTTTGTVASTILFWLRNKFNGRTPD